VSDQCLNPSSHYVCYCIMFVSVWYKGICIILSHCSKQWDSETLFVVCTQQYLTFRVMSYLAGQGASQVRTQGQVALGPDLVAVRIPAPVLASQVPVVAARVHLHRDLTSPAPLIGTNVAYSAVSLPRNKYSRLNTVYGR